MRQAGFVCGLILLCSVTGVAQGLKATVLAGAGGYVRTDCIAPVQVILENDETGRRGRLLVTLESNSRSVSSATRRMDMPPHSRKAVFLYMPGVPEVINRIKLRFVTESGKTLLDYTEPITALAANVPTFAVVGHIPATMPDRRNAAGERQYQSLTLMPEQLPDRAEGLEMYDALFLTPAPTVPLSRVQVEAIHAWVARGGVLVVDASKRRDSLQSGSLPGLLPFRPSHVEQGRLSVFGQETLFAAGAVVRGEVLLKSDGIPLAVRRNAGLGSVVCFAVAPEDPAYNDWPGWEDVWKDVLAPLTLPEKESDIDPAWKHKSVLASLVQAPRQTGLRMGLVIILIALYALIAGPVDYRLVRRLGRPRLTWITFPVIVLVFTLASWFGAKAWVGGSMAVTARERILFAPAENLVLHFRLVSVFVPVFADYRLRTDDDSPILPLRTDTAGLVDTAPTLDNSDGALTVRIPGWQERVFYASSAVPMEQNIGFELVPEPDSLSIRVRNGSALTLRRCSLIYGDRLWKLSGEFPPGEASATITGQGTPRNRFSPTVVVGPFTQANRDAESRTFWPTERELDIRDALRRGALVLLSEDAGQTPLAITVNGDRYLEPAHGVVLVVEYPQGVIPLTGQAEQLERDELL